MLFLSQAFAAYRAGQHDRALELTAAIIETDPNCADAFLCEGLIHRRRANIRGVLSSFQKCVALRPGEWLVEKLRADQAWQPLTNTTLEDAMALGGLLRARLPNVARALPAQHHKAAQQCINVIGTSLVRSFGGNDSLFPLFIGMGPTTNVLTDGNFAVARRKYADNLRRLDTRRPTMIVLNAEIYYHILDHLGTRPHRSKSITAADRELVVVLAERYRILLSDLKLIVGGRLLLLGQTPTFDPLMNEMSLDLNRRLAVICADIGVTLLDWWDDLVDPQSGMLRAELSAKAFPDDIHFDLSATGLFINKLCALGILGESTQAAHNFEWSHVFECEIEPSEKTRIWPEPSVSPNNAFTSHKIAAAHLGGRLADLMVTLLSLQTCPSILFVNCRDAWLPVNVPPQVVAGVVALTDTAANLSLGQMVLDFYGRSDITLMQQNDEALNRLRDQKFTFLVICLQPDTYHEDLGRATRVMGCVARPQNVIVTTPFPARLNEFGGLGFDSVVLTRIGHRHVPERWRETTLAMLM
jgi:hypothetical protein